ncbi:MAG TPA: HD domain-containing phosphohydrolase [Patescibacteria group bacterium]|nr:HD domain-containing phosphohydrolase [Patescibacteria group bacterium]
MIAARSPRRLTGNEINFLGRIMVVADVFKALTAVDRLYKKGKILSEAVTVAAYLHKPEPVPLTAAG